MIMRKAVTLVEMIVALAVFSLVMASAAGIMMRMYDSWQRQRRVLDVVQDLRWAIGVMSRDVRASTGTQIWIHGKKDHEMRVTMADGSHVWYWRGDDNTTGNSTHFYRGVGNNLNQASAAKEEVSGFAVENPGDADCFQTTGDTTTITMTARYYPLLPEGMNNENVTVRTAVGKRYW